MPSDFIISGEKFPLVDQCVTIGASEITLFSVPYSAEMLERIVKLRGLGEMAWPYWLEDWPATYALAKWLDEDETALPNAVNAAPGSSSETPGSASQTRGRFLDLGCGSGFLAAFLYQRFGVVPFSCDFNADACRLAGMNIARPQQDSPRARRAAPRRVFCADFEAFPSRTEFDVVFGGEMLYARDNQARILEFLDRHLAQGGSAYFADPGRSAAEGFSEAATAAGYAVEIKNIPSHRGDRNIHVYRLRGKSRIA